MLIYSAITSLDGYTTDPDGNFDWSAPDEEVLAFLNEQERRIGTYLYGRRMYEVMHYWENVSLDGQSAAARDFAGIWRAADKIVYSTSLPGPSTAVTPFVVGGGLSALLPGAAASLDLVDERRFASGVVYLHYRARARA
jgi:RibD C-terminal domain